MRDAVMIGLSAMIGSGIFVAIGPAAGAAGAGMLLGLLVAASVAYCNAASSAQLAALYPESGGTYVYARERLSPFWGWVAGWGFVVGKVASGAAAALTFGLYVHAPSARWVWSAVWHWPGACLPHRSPPASPSSPLEPRLMERGVFYAIGSPPA